MSTLGLALAVAQALGMALPEAQPVALGSRVDSEVQVSPGLSLFDRPGDDGVRARRVALLVAPGTDDTGLAAMHQALLDAGAVARHVSGRLGTLTLASGRTLEVEATAEALPSVLWDGMVLVADAAGQALLARDAQLQEFIRDQYCHAKPMLLIGDASPVLALLGIPAVLADDHDDPGLMVSEPDDGGAIARFIAALARHRHFEREADPPLV